MTGSKRLKIGVVVDQLLPGGVQLAAIEQVKNLRKLGHEAHLLILMRKKYAADFSYLVKDLPHRYLSDSFPKILHRPIKFPIFSFFSTHHLLTPFFVPAIIRQGDYDILVSHGTTTCLTTLALWRIQKIPYIAVIHDHMVYILEKVYAHTFLRYFFPIIKPLARLIEYNFVKEARETLIDSKVHFSYLKKNYAVTPKILPLGCQTLNDLPGKRGNYLLSFGRWQKEKNPFFLLKLVKSLPRAKLIIAGTWTNNQDFLNFQKSIKEERLENQVKVITHFNNNELKKICAQGRLWLNAHFEAFGLAALEAAGHGLPIIIPEKSGVTELFSHGVHGFFPKKISLREYQKYIQKLLEDEKLAYQMGKEGWQVVQKKYSWLANSLKLLELIRKGLGLEGKPDFTILEISHSKGTPLAGGDRLMEPMAEKLAGQYDLTIIVPRIATQHWQKVPTERKIKILPQSRFDRSGEPIPVFLAYCLRMWQSYKLLKKESKIKILYSSNNLLPDVFPAYFIKRGRPDIVWVARIHHLIPPPHQREGRLIVNIVSYLMQLLACWMIKKEATTIIALNHNLKNQLIARGFLKDRLHILGGGVEFEKIQKIKPDINLSFDGIFLGRLHTAKGIFDTIPIWAKVNEVFPQARLAIIGTGPASVKNDLRNAIQKAGLTEKIQLLGFLPSQQVYTIMMGAKAFLFTDHEAGWGLAAAEAMACGLPVVGYDTGIFGDVFHQGYLSVPCFNKQLFAQKIISLLKEESFRQNLSRAAVSQAKKLDWSKTSQKFFQILNQI